MSKYSFKQRLTVVAVSVVLLAACAPNVGREDMAKATEGYIEDTNKLFVVDCLLPGQVRKLGAQMTYISARRPIRTTAADCEVRGGEYVAYDRANYASSLKVWLPKAQDGDAEAQNIVGQVFEKGLGQPADYRAAFDWYKKAAEQGNSQAQLNLGHLYEKGLGTERNPEAADKWYRKASGLESAGLQFAPALTEVQASAIQPPAQTDNREIESLRREAEASRLEAEKSRREAAQMRAQLLAAQKQVVDQQESLRKAQDELEETRQKIQQEKSSPGKADDAALRQLEEELRQKQAQLRSQESRVAGMAASLNKESQALRRERETLRRQKIAAVANPKDIPHAQPSAGEPSELAQEQTALNEKINAYQKKSAELTEWLTSGVSDRNKIDERKKELQADARAISALRENIEQQSRKQLALNEPVSTRLAEGPRIEILDPPVTLTRGMPSIQVSGGNKLKEIVGRVNASDGLSALIVNERPQTVDGSGVFRVPVDFLGGQTQVKIVATDRKNRQADLLVSLVGESGGAQAEAFPASRQTGGARPADVNFGQFFAIIIGNADYKAFPGLKTPINDARSVELTLREQYGFKTTLLINANRHVIMTALNEMKKRLGERDNLLIYYAGHGEIDKSTQSAYWLPTDAEVGNPANWISSQNITEFLGIIPARHVMVVADSCYSGAMTGSAVAKLPEGMDESKRAKWLNVMISRKARTVLTSGDVRPVLDEGGGDHSIFANAFLRALRANHRVMEDYELFRDVSNSMRPASVRVGFQQSPQYAPLQHAGHEGSPFFFVPEA